MAFDLSLKQCLAAGLSAQVEQRIADDLAAMDAAQRAANDEEKSSAGDKYETGRAMMQRERAMYALRLEENLSLRKALAEIDIAKTYDTAVPGSALVTSTGCWILAVGGDDIELDGRSWTPISAASPLGKALLGAREGDTVGFRGTNIRIHEII